MRLRSHPLKTSDATPICLARAAAPSKRRAASGQRWRVASRRETQSWLWIMCRALQTGP
jgi:hypothetical protein